MSDFDKNDREYEDQNSKDLENIELSRKEQDPDRYKAVIDAEKTIVTEKKVLLHQKQRPGMLPTKRKQSRRKRKANTRMSALSVAVRRARQARCSSFRITSQSAVTVCAKRWIRSASSTIWEC